MVSKEMKEQDVKKYWEANAEAWTILSREGFDVYRDYVNTPAFMKMLGEVKGLRGLDIGCGEGHNTRKIAEKGALMTGIDLSEKFICHAHQKEHETPLHINYITASGLNLPFDDEEFDFCTAIMSLMDMPHHEKAIMEAYRVLKEEGFFQFSMTHPCFATPKWQWFLDEKGERIALMCGDYYRQLDGEISEWIFSHIPDELKNKFDEFKIPSFTRTLSSWLNVTVKNGFTLEQFAEPFADKEALDKFPRLADTRIIAYFLIVRCRKI
jgi:ubiquinone/menaquinone biosynthesis C-methylase UbiE